ncbi:MAG: hypothetical protein H0T92_15065 [Pyrinomonadaceae bacterium]|nr:hypothetical protein [Pyrinomonadaceae bacterium]
MTEMLVSSEGIAGAVARGNETLEIDPTDTRHMFWKEMKRLFFAMLEVEPYDFDDETMGEFLSTIDGVLNIL